MENICVEIYGFNIVIVNEFSPVLEAVKRFLVKEADTDRFVDVGPTLDRLIDLLPLVRRWDAEQVVRGPNE